jgi:hypothetical protein
MYRTGGSEDNEGSEHSLIFVTADRSRKLLHSAERPLAVREIQEQWNGRCSLVHNRLKNAVGLQTTAKKTDGRIGLFRGEAGRMSGCDWRIGSVIRRLAPSMPCFAVNGPDCNEKSLILFTMSN